MFFSCAEKSKYPIEVAIEAGVGSGYSKVFEVDSIVGKFAYKDGIKIKLNKVIYIKFK